MFMITLPDSSRLDNLHHWRLNSGKASCRRNSANTPEHSLGIPDMLENKL